MRYPKGDTVEGLLRKINMSLTKFDRLVGDISFEVMQEYFKNEVDTPYEKCYHKVLDTKDYNQELKKAILIVLRKDEYIGGI